MLNTAADIKHVWYRETFQLGDRDKDSWKSWCAWQGSPVSRCVFHWVSTITLSHKSALQWHRINAAGHQWWEESQASVIVTRRLTGYITNPYCGRLSLGLTCILRHWDHNHHQWPSYNCQTFKWPWYSSWFITLLASDHMITWLVLRFSSTLINIQSIWTTEVLNNGNWTCFSFISAFSNYAVAPQLSGKLSEIWLQKSIKGPRGHG